MTDKIEDEQKCTVSECVVSTATEQNIDQENENNVTESQGTESEHKNELITSLQERKKKKWD